MKLKLGRAGRAYDGMLFGEAEPLPPRIEAVYRLEVNEFNGTQSPCSSRSITGDRYNSRLFRSTPWKPSTSI